MHTRLHNQWTRALHTRLHTQLTRALLVVQVGMKTVLAAKDSARWKEVDKAVALAGLVVLAVG